ncbi:hypothetical protein AAFF_G00171630 [Aldrovandia affinis]|uniref:Uncharacterized protein n=1 Tax=Aldrovandia affinis TaxID=143900 RepID=A0AAD7SZR3_9TELE|nr:hypothetical protein AAFF_G00171630 [Aldrovandia affinis]
MAAESQAKLLIVSAQPPWYTMDHASAKEFTCDSVANLYLDIHKAMTKEIRGLIPPWWVQWPENLLLNPKSVTMTKIAKASVLNCMQFPQNPSASLVRALMDLVDLEAGNEFKTVRDGEGDRGGVKCVLLMTNNYLAYYLPPQSLQPKNALRIVPTVTYWHEDTMWWQDASTSNVATYTVPLNIASDKSSYFIQEVLAVPGLKSLELLRSIVGDRFTFWDIALELPVHPDAVTPKSEPMDTGAFNESEVPHGPSMWHNVGGLPDYNLTYRFGRARPKIGTSGNDMLRSTRTCPGARDSVGISGQGANAGDPEPMEVD